MRIVCLADLHGFLPAVPTCDLLLVAGDICPTGDERPPTQELWLRTTFARWLDDAPAGAIVGVAGNHDFVGETDPDALRALEWHYLQDESIAIDGLSIYGSPWTSRFQEWAFMQDEEELAARWARIPTGVDVLCTHSPPLGYGDRIGDVSIGSPSLLAAIDALEPRLCVFGHLHSGFGRWRRGPSILVNASYTDMDYLPAHEPVVVDLT
jgi:Icc-related predicted phosphoesterase